MHVCIFNLYFPVALSRPRPYCLLMCISRRLDDWRVIGATGGRWGRESKGGAGRRLITGSAGDTILLQQNSYKKTNKVQTSYEQDWCNAKIDCTKKR